MKRRSSALLGLVSSLTLYLGFTFTALAAAQECTETARTQIEAVLDKTTNRPLLREVVGGYGDEGKRILVEIAANENEPAKRRGQALSLLGEHRSPAGERLLLDWLQKPEYVCSVIAPLSNYRSPAIVPALMSLLDDRRYCGNIVRFDTSHSAPHDETPVYVSDEAVDALERITGQQKEPEKDLFKIGHRATEPWKLWWKNNREAYMSDSRGFLTQERDEGHDDDHYNCSVYRIAVSPDGRTAFSAGKSYDPWVRAWNVETRQQIWAVPSGRDDDASSARFSPDGRIVAVGTSNGTVRIFDATDGRRLRMLIDGRGVDSVAFSPDGAVLASASDDGTIRFFDTRTWCEAAGHIDNQDMTEGIAFSPDGRLIAAATFEQVRLWNVASLSEVGALRIQPANSPTTFIDEGQRQAQLWKMAWQVAFSPNGKFIATGSSAAVQVWDANTLKQVYSTSSGGDVAGLHFTSDGNWVVWGNDHDKIVKWNPATGKTLQIKNEFSLGDIAITPDDKTVLSPDSGQTIAMFDLSTRKRVGELRCQKR